MNLKKRISGLQKSLKQAKRVIKVATKPEKDEFWAVVKITLLGMAIIGAIGYIIKSANIALA